MKKYNYLKVTLKDLGYRYTDLSKELNTTPATVSNRLNGKSDFRMEELRKLLDLVGKTSDSEKCKLLNL